MFSIQSQLLRKSPELVSSYVHIPENLETFDFDTYMIDECFVLKNIAGFIFKKMIDELNFKVNEEYLTKFIYMICERYNKNYFHNFQHAINVLQMTYLLLNKTDIIKKLNPNIVFAVLIAALSHDVDHPGNTNSYEINSMSKYAKLYNDISVLENHHCSLTFEILESSKLLESFKDEQFREIRKTIIYSILGTDMSKHNEFIQKLELFDFDREIYSIDEQIFIASIFVHFADLSNPIKDFDSSYEWSQRISLEFYNQTIKEEMEGLPSLSFMKVHDTLSMCINEINFITNISIPTWQLFIKKFKNMDFILEKINNVLIKWKQIKKQYVEDNDINNLIY
jgi:hypothetical protein